LREFESAFLVALNHLVTAILYAPYVLSQEHWPAGTQWVYLVGFGMFQIGLPYVIFARGLRTVTGHESSFLTLLEPLLVPVWVYWAWGDMPTGSTLAGGGLILTGLVLRYWPRRATRVVADS
jgi:DME family drug/metabolite transporter